MSVGFLDILIINDQFNNGILETFLRTFCDILSTKQLHIEQKLKTVISCSIILLFYSRNSCQIPFLPDFNICQLFLVCSSCLFVNTVCQYNNYFSISDGKQRQIQVLRQPYNGVILIDQLYRTIACNMGNFTPGTSLKSLNILLKRKASESDSVGFSFSIWGWVIISLYRRSTVSQCFLHPH